LARQWLFTDASHRCDLDLSNTVVEPVTTVLATLWDVSPLDQDRRRAVFIALNLVSCPSWVITADAHEVYRCWEKWCNPTDSDARRAFLNNAQLMTAEAGALVAYAARYCESDGTAVSHARALTLRQLRLHYPYD